MKGIIDLFWINRIIGRILEKHHTSRTHDLKEIQCTEIPAILIREIGTAIIKIMTTLPQEIRKEMGDKITILTTFKQNLKILDLKLTKNKGLKANFNEKIRVNFSQIRVVIKAKRTFLLHKWFFLRIKRRKFKLWNTNYPFVASQLSLFQLTEFLKINISTVQNRSNLFWVQEKSVTICGTSGILCSVLTK